MSRMRSYDREEVRKEHVESLLRPSTKRPGGNMERVTEAVTGMYTCIGRMQDEDSDHWRIGLMKYARDLRMAAVRMERRAKGLRRAVQKEVRAINEVCRCSGDA